MAIQFPDFFVTATSNSKVTMTKTVKLTFANFTTGGTAQVLAVLPADSSILDFQIWTKTKLSGGGITAATLSIGDQLVSATQFANGLDALTPASGAFAPASPVTNIMQPYGLPLGPDIRVLFTGTATTGNPTAGEIYVVIEYVR